MAVEERLISLWEMISNNFPKLISLGITLLVIAFIYFIVMSSFKKILLLKAKTKKDKNNALMVIKLWRYIFLSIAILAAIFVTTGSFVAFGVSAGLFTAALGWALQRPITGIAAWMMVMIKRPFKIGDRILIDNVKGDVIDITMTHVYIGELGGIIGGEENSGRTVIIPNSILFEKNIINYTFSDGYILDQIGVTLRYESDLEEAMRLGVAAAKKVLGKDLISKTEEPYCLTYFNVNGINLYIRYKAPAEEIQKYSSKITQLVYKAFNASRRVKFSHQHVILKK
jgi:small-conductance mechanosensitive channel